MSAGHPEMSTTVPGPSSSDHFSGPRKQMLPLSPFHTRRHTLREAGVRCPGLHSWRVFIQGLCGLFCTPGASSPALICNGVEEGVGGRRKGAQHPASPDPHPKPTLRQERRHQGARMAGGVGTREDWPGQAGRGPLLGLGSWSSGTTGHR